MIVCSDSHALVARVGASEGRLARLERASAELEPPFAVVDLDAFWRNAADMERRACGKPIRLASKSVRCRALQERVLAREGFSGTLAFTLPEALWLADAGLQNIVVAYPTVDRAALRALAERHSPAGIAVMVDSPAQLDLIESAVDTPIDVCIDLDAGLWLFDGRVKIGAKRSPVHTPAQAATLAREIAGRECVRLVGMMAYEAQTAGLGDAPPGGRGRGAAIRALQWRSKRELAPRRAAAVEAVEAVLSESGEPPLRFVNGGGTGSLELTSAEPSVTEIAAGSGLYGPTLFDAYRAFAPEPAALFALPVVRKPAGDVATVLGGGYLASGPADAARLPQPFLPAGLRLDAQEGAGEVQTPLLGAAARQLRVGDRVWFRHAKAGELCERFDRLHLIEGELVVEQAPTYRGEGNCFL
ncbi:MAG TPA: amino acid deaminase/aldolase [Solirubrobacteraceae bacterium]|jgi:D-serine deaminase-like pyridoxal phosphate-dependent protein|nr:amino acid deaminase/aldolase [Solirubrobacteraceae bacterium]